jgi:hypothetical protein
LSVDAFREQAEHFLFMINVALNRTKYYIVILLNCYIIFLQNGRQESLNYISINPKNDFCHLNTNN